MKPEQKHTPKYWVVHDKGTDGVFLRTAHKSKNESEELFVVNTLIDNFKYDNEESAWGKLLRQPRHLRMYFS